MKLDWLPGYVIKTEIYKDTVIIKANREGLLSLADHLKKIADLHEGYYNITSSFLLQYQHDLIKIGRGIDNFSEFFILTDGIKCFPVVLLNIDGQRVSVQHIV
jgi:hypothetical protein